MDERARLLHAIEAVDAIQRYTADGREAFSPTARPKTR
jgi:hypothetical protein